MAEPPPEECAVCADIKKKQIPGVAVLVSEQDLEPWAPSSKKKLKPQKRKDFLTKLNAVVNDGGGLVCLHGVDPHMLGSFDQSVNLAMASLISDDTSYPDNFERHLKKDNHVIFRVKQRERPLSTYCFNTKISYDKGVENPTHGQMKCFLAPKETEDDEGATSNPVVNYEFRYEQEVKVEFPRRGNAAGQVKEGFFQEGIDIQAKRVPSYSAGRTAAETIDNMTKPYFDVKKPATFLPRYFAAFSKLKNGGSVFIGVEEDKVIQGGSEIDTGIFKCQGVVLTEEEQEVFREVVMDRAKTMMYWHPGIFPAGDAQPETSGSESPSFEPPIEIHFHAVENYPPGGRVVPQIVVKKYPGMAFFSPGGPESYEIQRSNEDTCFASVMMSKENWFEKQKEMWCENCHRPTDVESCVCPK